MEESSASKQEEARGSKEDCSEKQTNAATEEASSQMSNAGDCGKPTQGTAARFNRLKLFDKVMQKSLSKFIEHASFKGFSGMFHPLYKKNPQKMESIHKQFTEELQKSIQDDISRLIEEGMLEFKLNELDKMESAAKSNSDPAWRPSGDPEQDFCSFLMPYYLKQEAYIRLELKKIQAENAALAQKVQAGRETIAQTEQRISTAVDECKASMTEFEGFTSSLCPADIFDV